MCRSAIIDPIFFRGGNATFTVENPAGEHYTFRIRQYKPDAPFYLTVLTGPDNESAYSYIGVYLPEDGKVKLTPKSPPISKQMRIAQWALDVVHKRRDLPDGYSIMHSGRCGRCARKLTVPESIRLGIGPSCAAEMGIPYGDVTVDKADRLNGLRAMVKDLEDEMNGYNPNTEV